MTAQLCRLFLVRHGEVDEPWRRRIYGDLDVPLSGRGRAEARRAAIRLAGTSLDAVVSSGLERAEYGARELRTARGLERRDEPDLREIMRGRWKGWDFDALDVEEARVVDEWMRAPARLRPPEGESLLDLSARVIPRVDALAGEFSGGAIALVTHAWVTRVVLCHALELDLDAAPDLDIRTGGILALDWPERGAGHGSGFSVTLAGFGLDRAPERRSSWARGGHRGTESPPPA